MNCDCMNWDFTNWDCIAVMVAFLSVLVTCYIAWSTLKQTKMIAEKELNYQLLNNSFYNVLFVELPAALDAIEGGFDCTVSEKYNVLDEKLYDILKAARFYKYYDYTFYDKIKKDIMKIDDVIISMVDQQELNQSQYEKYKEDIMENISNLYRTIKENYFTIPNKHK